MGYPALINIDVSTSNDGDTINAKLKGSLVLQPVAGSRQPLVIKSSKLPGEVRLQCSVAEENLLKGYVWVVYKPIDPTPFAKTHTPKELLQLIFDLLVEAGWEDCRDENSP